MELEEIGLTPYKALKASTTHPMDYLGELDDAGRIEVGIKADLVLLEANPLEDITNTEFNRFRNFIVLCPIKTGSIKLVGYYFSEKSNLFDGDSAITT